MNPDFGSYERNDLYGFSTRGGQADQDRHIQNIFDHANNIYPEHAVRTPLFPPSTQAISPQYLGNPQSVNHDEDSQHLDEFDRGLLGHRHSTQHPSNIDNHRQRVSLPLNRSTEIQRRVLGDASHHFRPFSPQSPPFQSLFQRNPLRIGNPFLGSASQPDYGENGSSQLRELEQRRWKPEPFSHGLSRLSPSLNSSVAASSSSPSQRDLSSPSTRLSLKKHGQIANRPPQTPQWTKKMKLDLNHASKVPPIVNNTRLIDPRQALPDKFRAVFPYELFNAVQSKCFPLVYENEDNFVMSAPTGSGKTAILEMAICKLAATQGGDNFKIVYQAPTKSLCSERARDWEKKFSHMNLRCVELTGDTSQAQASRVGTASIIVTTPEKWDSITRKWSDHRKLLAMVRLVLIDEVHILKDVRGATLEAVVSRMKTIGANVRFVALSATVPNIEDVAKWLGRNHDHQAEPAMCESFGEELRPVKLQRYVYGYDGSPNDYCFEKSLDGKLNMLLAKHTERKPIMIFCFTRKSCESTARKLAEWWSSSKAEKKAWPVPTKRVPVINRDLQEMVRYGVAFHHAGLDSQDRTAVEQHFLSGQLHVICCTSTLAVGVNLPCHTVVLKGTVGYSNDKAQEYSDLEVMQMLGRAGRPQFDNSAVAIIMTRRSHVDRYNKMISGQENLESTLHENLIEHLNSEIGLGTIQNMETARRWIGGTFLSVRVRQSPHLYKLENVHDSSHADEQMAEWCERDVSLLREAKLVSTQTPLTCTDYGIAMSRYMVSFETMQLLLSIARGASMEQMLTTLCKATELREFRLKPNERPLFRELNKSPFILYPIKETICQTWHKVSLLVQVHLGGVEIPAPKESGVGRFQLAKEKTMIFDRLNRLVRCVVDCKSCDNDGAGTKAGLDLLRAVAANSWENKPWQLSQIPGFGPVTVRKWVSHGVHTVLAVAGTGMQDIERISIRNPPYGSNVLKALESFPRLTMTVDLKKLSNLPLDPQDYVQVSMTARLGYTNSKSPPIWNGSVPTVTFLVNTTDGRLAYFWRGNLRKFSPTTGMELKFPVALSGPHQLISCHFTCEEIVGTQVIKTLTPQIPASAFNKPEVQIADENSGEPDLIDDDMDEDMLDMVDGHDQDKLSHHSGPLDDESVDNFPLIDELLSQETPQAEAQDAAQETPASTMEPAKMENGKWMCNHYCRNGRLTKKGKKCSHRCCREGVDVLRILPQKKGKGISDDKLQREGSPRASGAHPQPSKAKVQPRLQSTDAGYDHQRGTSSQVGRGSSYPSTSKAARRHDMPGLTKDKHSGASNLGRSVPRRDSLSDIDFIDLSALDEETEDSNSTKKPLSSTAKSKNKLLSLHDKVQGHVSISPRLTKSHSDKKRLQSLAQEEDPHSGHVESPRIPTPNDFGPQLDSYLSEVDDDDFPELEELLGNKLVNEEVTEGGEQNKEWDNDETLYPGMVHTLKESMDYG
ncbi:P-loop containing nucleoside triphosphate hydrolase protein [Xylariomycetidae sp. FL2044]|nr:P-loop containing nucleoside triphosphate hydrolase protein [Xylariomycetidae sp. FL2044]